VSVAAFDVTAERQRSTKPMCCRRRLNGGSVARQVIEMASTDMCSLFRYRNRMTPVSCLLAVLNMNAVIGTILPLRIRTAAGTAVGEAGSVRPLPAHILRHDRQPACVDGHFCAEYSSKRLRTFSLFAAQAGQR
jgi:hypothetical protein